MADEYSALTRRLIADGLKPKAAQAPVGLYQAFFDAAMDTLRQGAPGLTDVSRSAIARSIAMKCERAAKQQERAA